MIIRYICAICLSKPTGFFLKIPGVFERFSERNADITAGRIFHEFLQTVLTPELDLDLSFLHNQDVNHFQSSPQGYKAYVYRAFRPP